LSKVTSCSRDFPDQYVGCPEYVEEHMMVPDFLSLLPDGFVSYLVHLTLFEDASVMTGKLTRELNIWRVHPTNL
jgi:hypothetical protein